MKKKEDVYLVVDSREKAIELEEVLKMFSQNVYRSASFLTANKYPISYCNVEYRDYQWSGSSEISKEEVSLQELKNILAAEYLKPGDEVVLGIGDTTWNATFIGMKGIYFRAQYAFNGDKWLKPHIEDGCFLDFIRFNGKTDDDVAIIERLHDTLLEKHGYSLDSELLTKARKLSVKLRNK